MFWCCKRLLLKILFIKFHFQYNLDTIFINCSKKMPLFKSIRCNSYCIIRFKPYIKKGDKLYARVYQVGQNVLFIGRLVNDLKMAIGIC